MSTCPATHPRCQHQRPTDYANYGCRCDTARAARNRRRKTAHLRSPSWVPAIGTRRRLQALLVQGWSQYDLAVRLGRKRQSGLSGLVWTDHPFVEAELAQRVHALYEQLADHPGPSKVTRNRALARGWLGPLWWDDDTIDDPSYQPSTLDTSDPDDIDPVAVELAITGRPLPRPLTRTERRAAIVALTRRALSANEIAERLAVTDRTVTRDLADLRGAA